MDRTIEMKSSAPTNAGKHITSNFACAHSQQYTNNSVFWLTKWCWVFRLYINTHLLLDSTSFQMLWKTGFQYVNFHVPVLYRSWWGNEVQTSPGGALQCWLSARLPLNTPGMKHFTSPHPTSSGGALQCWLSACLPLNTPGMKHFISPIGTQYSWERLGV